MKPLCVANRCIKTAKEYEYGVLGDGGYQAVLVMTDTRCSIMMILWMAFTAWLFLNCHQCFLSCCKSRADGSQCV